jgi:hypothetical protein
MSGGPLITPPSIRIYGARQEHALRTTLFSVYFSACVVGYEERGVKTANGKIEKEQEQTEAQPVGA